MTGAGLYARAVSRLMVLILAGLVLLVGPAGPILVAGAAQPDRNAQVKTVVIPVQGMVCVACAATVKRTLKSIDGVSNVEVSLEKRTAQVSYAPDKLSPDRLVAAINQAGYRAGIPAEQP